MSYKMEFSSQNDFRLQTLFTQLSGVSLKTEALILCSVDSTNAAILTIAVGANHWKSQKQEARSQRHVQKLQESSIIIRIKMRKPMRNDGKIIEREFIVLLCYLTNLFYCCFINVQINNTMRNLKANNEKERTDKSCAT